MNLIIHYLSLTLVGVCAFLQFAFLYLEMFLWTTPFGLKILRMTPELAQATKVLALNQGLYNGFLGAGLLWGLFTARQDVIFFFLLCMLLAGILGGASASSIIYYVQALPAGVTLLILLIQVLR